MKQSLIALCLTIGVVIGLGAGYLTYETKIRGYQSQVFGLTSEISDFKSTLGETEAKLIDEQGKVSNLSSRIYGLETEIEDLKIGLSRAETQISTLESEKTDLISDLTETQRQIGDYESQINNLEDKLSLTNNQLTQLQIDHQNLFARIEQSSLENPTWQDVKEFLEKDDTDKMVYDSLVFDCSGFAITLRDRAWRYGFRSAYVEIEFVGGDAHALDAFQTTDRGLVYVDNTEADKIAYVQVGQPYGIIHLEGVKSRYIDCNGDPAKFWGDLTFSTHPDPLSYNYYTDYQRRVQFYYESVEAYNKAVNEYSRGSKKYSYSQLMSWLENIEELENDLGTFYKSMGTVQNVEMYWD